MNKLITKLCILLLLIVININAKAEEQFYIDMDIEGVSCPFCIQVLIKNLSKVPGIANVDMNTENKELLITMKTGQQPNIQLIKKTILVSGYLTLRYTQSLVKSLPNKTQAAHQHVAIKNQPCSNCHNN